MNTTPSNIYLIGPMGTGKTTVGRQLAGNLNKYFIDSDHEIEKRTGVDISTIFEYEGEQGFRIRENKLITEITAQQNVVLATGGGTILDSDNRALLNKHGFVVYLHAPVGELIERTSKDKNRPLLQTDNPTEVLTELIKAREPLYQDIADAIIDTSNTNIKTITQSIMDLYNNAL